MRAFDLNGAEAVLHLEGEGSGALAWGYRAQLRGHSLLVNRAITDDNPATFADFFESLARDRQGWPETRAYESLDGTMNITATHDGLRAVRFEVRLRGDSGSGFDWSAAHRLTVELGQLDGIAAAARDFAFQR